MKLRWIAMALALSACAGTVARRPQSAPGPDDAVNALPGLVDGLSADSCVPALVNARLPDTATVDWPAPESVRDRSRHWLDTLFAARIRLRSRIPELVRDGAHDPCLRAIHRFLVGARESEELLIEAMEHYGLAPVQGAENDDAEAAFRGVYPATLVNPAFGALEFRPGDVILDRGDSSVSAEIARVGEVGDLFSHTMIVGEDGAGALYIVETTAKDVVGITPLAQYFHDNPDVRMAAYRPKDADLGHRAARFIYDYVTNHKKEILYDFHMNESDPREMFCSEVVQFAYRGATKGSFVPPMYKTDVTRFDGMGKANWLRKIGVPYAEIYAPFDIDLDPRFDLLADYRYAPALREHRIDDAVMTSIYDWMVNRGYYFPLVATDHLMADIGKVKAMIFGDKEIAKNMPIDAIRVALEFDRVFELVKAKLTPAEEAYYEEHGHPMSFVGMLGYNDRILSGDCAEWRQRAARAALTAVRLPGAYIHDTLFSRQGCPRAPGRASLGR